MKQTANIEIYGIKQQRTDERIRQNEPEQPSIVISFHGHVRVDKLLFNVVRWYMMKIILSKRSNRPTNGE